MTEQELLEAYIQCHNQGVESGDFSEMMELFAPDAELIFVKVEFSPLRGRDAIAEAFSTHPPSDKLSAGMPSIVPTGATVIYEWAGQPGIQAGTIQATIVDGKIGRMVVYFNLV